LNDKKCAKMYNGQCLHSLFFFRMAMGMSSSSSSTYSTYVSATLMGSSLFSS
jgi:hypothetical protein